MSDAYKDHLGRPIIAVTGMGVITSLGQGVQDNWAALTSGTSGIHTITRFPTEGLSTKIVAMKDEHGNDVDIKKFMNKKNVFNPIEL